MRIKFIKNHPPTHGGLPDSFVPSTGAANYYNAPIKAMNLIMQGYAVLAHSCRVCNPYHINEKDWGKPFKVDNKFYDKNDGICHYAKQEGDTQ